MASTIRKSMSVLGLLAVGMIAAGCQSQKLVGTWEAQKNVPTNDPRVGAFQFGAVTFAPDGTYTAHMIYADRQLGESGEWTTKGDMLELKKANRAYRYSLHGDTLDLTDPKMNVSIALQRLR